MARLNIMPSVKEKYLQSLPLWSHSRQRRIDLGQRDNKLKHGIFVFITWLNFFFYVLTPKPRLIWLITESIKNDIFFLPEIFLFLPDWLVFLQKNSATWHAFQSVTGCNRFPKNRTYVTDQPQDLHDELWMTRGIPIRFIFPSCSRFSKSWVCSSYY